MRVRHYLLPLVAAAGVVLFALAPATAMPVYPPGRPALTVSPATLVGCGSVEVKGTGYGANEPVEIVVFNSPPAKQTIHADYRGAFSTTVRLSQVGPATITATGMDSGVSASANVTVVPPACDMPATGAGSGRLPWIGGAAIIGGALILAFGTLLWRRRYHPADI